MTNTITANDVIIGAMIATKNGRVRAIPTGVPDSSYYSDGRGFAFRWLTGETAENGEVAVELHTSHSKDEKAFTASLTVVTIKDNFIQWAVQIGGLRNGERPTHARIDRQSIARYSKLADFEFADRVLSGILSGWDVLPTSTTPRQAEYGNDILSRISLA